MVFRHSFYMEEKKLVQEILSGSKRALEKFYCRYKKKLLHFIQAKIQSEEDAEEIFQDTFLAAIEGLRDFSFRSSLFTYLCSIASHKIIDYYRKKKIKQIFFSKIPEIEPLISTFFHPEEELDITLLREKINQTFKKLAPKYQRILRLKYIDGYSVEEISQKLSISFKSAESTLFRARKAFAKAYQS